MPVEIYDTKNNMIGELMNASTDEILQYMKKGLIVIDKLTHKPMTESDLTNMIGCSDCVIQMG